MATATASARRGSRGVSAVVQGGLLERGVARPIGSSWETVGRWGEEQRRAPACSIPRWEGGCTAERSEGPGRRGRPGIADAVVYALERDGMNALRAGTLAAARASRGRRRPGHPRSRPPRRQRLHAARASGAPRAGPRVIVLTSRDAEVDCVACAGGRRRRLRRQALLAARARRPRARRAPPGHGGPSPGRAVAPSAPASGPPGLALDAERRTVTLRRSPRRADAARVRAPRGARRRARARAHARSARRARVGRRLRAHRAHRRLPRQGAAPQAGRGRRGPVAHHRRARRRLQALRGVREPATLVGALAAAFDVALVALVAARLWRSRHRGASLRMRLFAALAAAVLLGGAGDGALRGRGGRELARLRAAAAQRGAEGLRARERAAGGRRGGGGARRASPGTVGGAARRRRRAHRRRGARRAPPVRGRPGRAPHHARARHAAPRGREPAVRRGLPARRLARPQDAPRRDPRERRGARGRGARRSRGGAALRRQPRALGRRARSHARRSRHACAHGDRRRSRRSAPPRSAPWSRAPWTASRRSRRRAAWRSRRTWARAASGACAAIRRRSPARSATSSRTPSTRRRAGACRSPSAALRATGSSSTWSTSPPWSRASSAGRSSSAPTTSGKGKGSGLGLAIARAAVEAHGGRVHFVELGPPRVRVRVELPR